jgi:hypothetical protein
VTTKEQKQLARLESLLSRNQERFCEAGRALKEIRDNRLYKLALFDTFEAYTRVRWDISRAQAYRLIKYCQVIHNLSPIGDVLPANESQVRPLASLKPMEQRRIWKDFLASGTELTAQNIKRFISARDRKKADPPDLSGRITEEYMAAVKAMLAQVREARSDQWQKTSRQAALIWHRVIQENILSKEAGNE